MATAKIAPNIAAMVQPRPATPKLGAWVAALAFLWPKYGYGEDLALAPSPASAGDRGTWVRSADVRGHLRPRFAMLLDYARRPLTVMLETQHTREVVRDQWQLHALGSLALAERWLVALDVPLTLHEAGSGLPGELPEPGGAALGDMKLAVRSKPLGPAGEGLHLSVETAAWLPTAPADTYAGDDIVRFGGWVIVSGLGDRWSWSAESGVEQRETGQIRAILPMRLGSLWTAGVSARYLVDAARRWEVGPELLVQSAFNGGARLLDPESSQGLFALSARFRIPSGWFAGVSAGPGLGRAPGSADLRAALIAGWSIEREPPPPDEDEDGIADALDACAELRGERSSDPLMNGCPELPEDSDGDAIPNAFDACDRDPGPPNPVPSRHGCPKPPPAPPPPPPPAPAPPPATLEQQQIVIAEQIQFETGTAALLAESEPILNAVLQIVLAHPELTLIEVQGHTDTTGSPELNQRLSSDRARAVLDWLVARGVDPGRLRAAGYGSERPLADNADEAGRARNRRVEFHIVERRVAPEPSP